MPDYALYKSLYFCVWMCDIVLPLEGMINIPVYLFISWKTLSYTYLIWHHIIIIFITFVPTERFYSSYYGLKSCICQSGQFLVDMV